MCSLYNVLAVIDFPITSYKHVENYFPIISYKHVENYVLFLFFIDFHIMSYKHVENDVLFFFNWFSHNVIHTCWKRCAIFFTDFLMSYKHVENYLLFFTDFPIICINFERKIVEISSNNNPLMIMAAILNLFWTIQWILRWQIYR